MQTSNSGSRTPSSFAGSFSQSSYASRVRPAPLNLVPMIDIFTVLVTFLLMTAVFSRITILQLDLPNSSAVASGTPPSFRLEVIVRQDGFELTNGNKLIAAIPKVDGEYDLKTLSELALSLKREYPDANDASVLLEPNIAYDYLIRAMDAIRSTQVPASAAPNATGIPQTTKVALFAHIAVGAAP